MCGCGVGFVKHLHVLLLCRVFYSVGWTELSGNIVYSLHNYKCRMKDLQSLQLLLGSFVLFGIMSDFEDMFVFF